MIRISVVIVNYNARYFLKNCISSVLCSDIVDEIEIIVVDNNSQDGSCDMLRDEFPTIKCLRNTENLGFGKANNKGVKHAAGDYVLILNPDTMIGEDTLSQMLSFSEKQPNFGAAGVHFIDGSGSYLPESKRNFPNLHIAGAKLLGYSKKYYANQIDKDETAEVDILTGAFMFIKKDVYDEVGGFDEEFFMYGEDIDLSYRILKASYKNYYAGNNKVLHFKGESTVKDKTYLKNFYGALSIFHKKHFPNKVGFYRIVDSLIQLMISFKSLSLRQQKAQKQEGFSWIYLGNDKALYSLLEQKLGASKGRMTTEIEATVEMKGTVLFDTALLDYKSMIHKMSDPKLLSLRKRILSKDKSYYLGSDHSNMRGEIVQL